MPLNPPCVGRTVAIDASCGCTLSRMTITGLTPADIENFANSEIDVARLVLEAREAKMLGVPERGLSMLLKGRIKDLKPDLVMQKIDQQSIIQPFFMRTQKSFVNDNYFKIVAGQPTPGRGTGSIPVSATNVTVQLGGAWINDGGISKLEQSFVIGSTVIVHTWDNVATKTALTRQFTILNAVNADSGGTYQATITLVPNLTAAEWAALSGAQQSTYQPTFGVLQPAANNVDDREAYCNQQRAILNNKIILNWYQTSRNVVCSQQSYEEVVEAILDGKVNNYLKGFSVMGLAQQEKQKMARAEREWLNSVMYGQIINGNQTEANWRSLPQVYDPIDPTCQLGVKANALGFFTLLNNCNRVIDLGGNKLNLDTIFQYLYTLKRNREAEGDNIQVIDSMTNRYMADYILSSMTDYYQKKYHFDTVRYVNANQKIEHEGFILWNYNVYDIPQAGVQWAVYVDDYFNDYVDSFNYAVVGWDFRTRANSIWFIDWSDAQVGMLKTRSVERKWPSVDPVTAEVYKCVIQPNISTYRLTSKTYSPLLDRPNRHLIIHNFQFACPVIAAVGCSVPQS